MNDEEIRARAIEFARKNKGTIARQCTDPSKYIPDTMPISAFMAGSPGAGKTEFSKSLIEILSGNDHIKNTVIRIDGDELRPHMPGYSGKNSYLFQAAISIIVDKIQDLALKQRQTFVLDGTFSKYDKAVGNVRRSLEKDRVVFIFYVYQEPQVAWKFTEAREAAEGRNIPKSAFIDSFLGARDTVERIRKEFGDEVVLFLVKKDFEKHTVENAEKIDQNGPQIDHYIPKRYTRSELEEIL